MAKAIKANNKDYAMKRCCYDIIFAHVYPRLDVEVSKHMNHLLKAPFCVHPKTGRVCVPMDPANAENFDPMAVPTVAGLLNEHDRAGREGGGDGYAGGGGHLQPHLLERAGQGVQGGAGHQGKGRGGGSHRRVVSA